MVVGLNNNRRRISIKSTINIPSSKNVINLKRFLSKIPQSFLSLKSFSNTIKIKASIIKHKSWHGNTMIIDVKTPPNPCLIITNVQFNVIKNALYTIKITPKTLANLFIQNKNNNPKTKRFEINLNKKNLNEYIEPSKTAYTL